MTLTICSKEFRVSVNFFTAVSEACPPQAFSSVCVAERAWLISARNCSACLSRWATSFSMLSGEPVAIWATKVPGPPPIAVASIALEFGITNMSHRLPGVGGGESTRVVDDRASG